MARPSEEPTTTEDALTPEQKLFRAVFGTGTQALLDAEKTIQGFAREGGAEREVRIEDFRRSREPDQAMPDDLTDAKIAASEARTDTKFAELRGELAVISANLAAIGQNVSTQRTEASLNRNVMVATTIGTGLAVIGAIVAMLSYGAATFYNGTVMRDAVNTAVSERTSTSESKK